ncbi:hypothetical protein PoB_002707200 [Plakobranchus ocellatus]|uniref:Uncharacterized protein n=1 Tax=Plakobranchus ocellatus TaxID=259542 RepID=A0AAV4A125_9GAST|nr:hypothetical protein PoB_002707200 [Plakobranchus ocellatus]
MNCPIPVATHPSTRSVGGIVAIESTLRSAGTLLSRVRAPPPTPWPDGGPESLRSSYCGLAIYKTKPPFRTHPFSVSLPHDPTI